MLQSPFWDTSNLQEILNLVWNLKVHGSIYKNPQRIGNPKEKSHLEDLNVDRSIIIKFHPRVREERVCLGCMWPRTDGGNGILWT
jgi:hypothetical protein